MFTALIVVMQFMISAQAGLVNYVEGPVNVQLHQQVPAGTPIQTGPQGHAEILLNPGSFLRVGENSTVMLDSTELTQIAVRVVNGIALIESAEIDKHAPIRVTTGNLTTLILSKGLYRFSGDTASVIDGKLRTADSSLTVKKGQQVTAIDNRYNKRTVTLNAEAMELDRWSERRSAQLAAANALAYRERSTAGLLAYGGFPYWGLYPNRSAWLYSLPLNGFTLIPRNTYKSHWGFRFTPGFAFGGSVFRGRPGGFAGTLGSRQRAPGRIGARSRGFGGLRRR
jgi:FecR-like protein